MATSSRTRLEDLEVVLSCALEHCRLLICEREHKCSASRPLATLRSVEDEIAVVVDLGTHRRSSSARRCFFSVTGPDV
jgi:hypothetical protein